MSDLDKDLPESIRQALKNSPPYQPPERFYQDVMRKARQSPAPESFWRKYFGGYRGPTWLVAVCAMSFMLMIAKEQKVGFVDVSVRTPTVASENAQAKPVPAPMEATAPRVRAHASLADNKERESRGAPIRLEDDLKDQKSGGLYEQVSPISKVAQAAPRLKGQVAVDGDESNTKLDAPAFGKKEWVEQARATTQGAAYQNSFPAAVESQPVVSEARRKAVPAMRALPDVWSGPLCAIHYFRTAVITTQEDWVTLRGEQTGLSQPPEERMTVDFEIGRAHV